MSALPEGYDTLLGRRGVNLSGGRRQRLAIARALVCEPAVLIMDDCTSALDAVTETRLTQALGGSSRTYTRIIVAQRVASVVAADRILVLEDGRIVEQGTHADLLKARGTYQRLYELQFGGLAAG